jgi:hypothetical protein
MPVGISSRHPKSMILGKISGKTTHGRDFGTGLAAD